MRYQSTSSVGCLALIAFCGWPVIGATLSMPATALYLHRHYPAQLQQSDHWLLFAGIAPIAALLVAWWTTRKRSRPTVVIAVRATALLLVSFAGTLWTLEQNEVSVEAVTLVSIFTGWGSILALLALIPLLNLIIPARPSAGTPTTTTPTTTTPTQRIRPPAPPRSRQHGRDQSRNQRRNSGRGHPDSGQNGHQPRSDGKPQYRTQQHGDSKTTLRHQSAGDGKPRYRYDPADDRKSQGRQPEQRDGKPQYREDPDPGRWSDGDGKPVYRSDR